MSYQCSAGPPRPGKSSEAAARRRLSSAVTVAALGLVLTGCSSIGPGSVPRDRVDYANALSDSW